MAQPSIKQLTGIGGLVLGQEMERIILILVVSDITITAHQLRLDCMTQNSPLSSNEKNIVTLGEEWHEHTPIPSAHDSEGLTQAYELVSTDSIFKLVRLEVSHKPI
jgi:hypothetical protein